ncbi:MAG TPA: Stk1 family PASTA domain-containing Ser/Thr kinase [Erysipelothrix sp.]
MNEIIGSRYQVIKKIGAGGMADVYLALDTVLDREVALKVLRGSLAHDPVALLRFQREAESASGLNHENIVDVYDVGEDDGHHYIVMEMIRGTTLKELLHRRGSLDKYEAVSIMEQLVSALARAHQEKVIHRDIKPQNILVKDDGTVKIADFGIALAGDALQLTKSDSVLGSVHYLAPECSRGEGASMQSDIYALGVVFYELLTGEVPFKGESAVEIAMKHMRDEFPSILDFNPALPHSFENIIRKATHKNKLYRYKHVSEMMADLKTSLEPQRLNEALVDFTRPTQDETILFEQIQTSPQQVSPETKKRKWIFPLILVLVILFSVGAVYAFTKPKKIKELEMPDLSGKTIDEAREILEPIGLHINPNYVYQYSDEFDYLKIISSRPTAGSQVLVGSQIRLTISQGKTFEIGNYEGMTLTEVKDALAGQNVQIKTIKEYHESYPAGYVIRQELLEPGTKINPDQKHELILVMSSQMETIVPSDLIGTPLDSAITSLKDKGLAVETEALSLDNLSLSEIEALDYNTVIRSHPMPGSYYVQSEGKAIVLYYYDEKDRPVEETQVEEDKKESDDDEKNEQ